MMWAMILHGPGQKIFVQYGPPSAIVDWFFDWISANNVFLEKIFTKKSTIDQIKKATGLKPENSVSDIVARLGILANILKYYVQGMPLNELNDQITDINRADNTGYLVKETL
jgi:hypothetical protein